MLAAAGPAEVKLAPATPAALAAAAAAVVFPLYRHHNLQAWNFEHWHWQQREHDQRHWQRQR